MPRKFHPASPERYIASAEHELATAEAEAKDRGLEWEVAAIRAEVAASLAVAAATVAHTTVVSEKLDALLNTLHEFGGLMAAHPVFQHVIASRAVVAEQNAEIDDLKERLAVAEAANVPNPEPSQRQN